ncbi:MAG: lipocalin family protein, partial [Thermomicrobiales bacterium]
ILDQELNTLATTGVIYWEGAVHVKGLSAGEEVTGVGYVELTGYAVST